MKRALLATSLLVALAGCKRNPPHDPPGTPSRAGGLAFEVPAGAVSEQPTSSMRLAQYRLPRVEVDGEDAELVVFYFGAGQGGSAQANLARWCSEFTDGQGHDRCRALVPRENEVNGMKITSVALRGHYRAQDMLTGQAIDKPGYALLAAVAETPEGPYFFKLTGPQRAVDRWQPGFERLLMSLRPQPKK